MITKSVPTILLAFGIALPGLAQRLETVIQKGHELAVISVAVSPDNSVIATGSKDKSIKLWEKSTGRELRSLLGHDDVVTCLDFSADGKYLISGSYDRSVRIWEVETGRETHVLIGEDFITDVAFDPKSRFFVSVGFNRGPYGDSATVYDFTTRNILRRVKVDANRARAMGAYVAISPDGEWIGFGEDNRVINIYKTATWEKAHKFEYEQGWCGGCSTMLQFHPDNQSVFMGSYKGPFKKYDLKTGQLLNVYEEQSESLTGITISSDGKLVARTTETTLTVWDEATGDVVANFKAEPKANFHEIAFLNNDSTILISSDNNTAFGWNVNSGTKEFVLTGFLNSRDMGGLNYNPNFHWQAAIARYVRLKNALLITKDGKTLIKGKFGTKVRQWDIASGKAVMEFTGHRKAVLCYDLSRDGQTLVTGGGDGTIILWDVETGDSLKVIRSYREPIFDIHFSSDEKRVASTSWDGSMKIHNLETGLREFYFEFQNNAAYNILFHPNDLYLFTAQFDHSLKMWELDTRTEVRTFTGHTGLVSSLRITKDQKTLLTAGWDGTVRLWDIGTGLMNRKWKVATPVHIAIFSDDEKLIYSGGADRLIRIWEATTGKLLHTLSGHNAEITSLLLSPDNKMLISHSVDGVTKFWDLASRHEFFEHIHLGETDWMVKNPDGYFNGTDNARKYIHFVDGLKSYAVDQFFNEFFRPDLLPEIFHQRGGSGEMKGIQGKLNHSPPPTVQVAAIPTTPGKADIIIRVKDNGAGADNVKLFHNGKSIPLLASGEKDNVANHVTYKQEVNLIGGINEFSATATNRDRVESNPQRVEIFSAVATKSSTCHVLAVGINDYKNPKLALNYARPDAVSFSKLMDERGTGLFKAIELHALYDDQATRPRILEKLDQLAKIIQPQDVFIFYYAGHGSMVDNKFYFIPMEASRLYDPATVPREAIEASLLQEKFKNIAALKQLIIMDACQSGGSVELLANRGATEEKAIAQLSRSAGIHVMASAGSEQFATEFSELGHGVFTYALIRALQGDADGAPKDGKVTIYELKSYIDDQVPELTRRLKGKPQYPYTFSRGQDFPVVLEE